MSNRTKVQDPDSVLAYAYDGLDRLTRVDNNGTPGVPRVALASKYDLVGNRVALDELTTGGTTTRTDYDAQDRPTAIRQQNSPYTPLRFDFGTASSTVEPGHFPVTPATTYASTGFYGWTAGTVLAEDRTQGAISAELSAATPSLFTDLNFATDATFEVAVNNGTYDVTVSMGDSVHYAHEQTELYLEGALVDRPSPAGYQVLTRTYTTTVSDGKLTVRLKDAGGPDAYATILALEFALRPATPLHLKYDFGTATSPLAPGFLRATEADYSGTVGYGWKPGSGTRASLDRGDAAGSFQDRDLVYTTDATFVVAWPNGTYDVTVSTGDRSSGAWGGRSRWGRPARRAGHLL